MDHTEHSFIINLDEEDPHVKPLPSVIRRDKRTRLSLPTMYPKFEAEFYETVAECAEMIDKISDVNLKLKYHNDLNKIFILRNKQTVMRLFRELVNFAIKGR